jgi:O-antigen/teichoic acid export membrane protein
MSDIDLLDTAEAGRRVVRGGALRAAGFVSGVALSVLGAALVTRHLGQTDYGRFQTVIALVTIVQAVTDVGMSTLGLREYSQRQGEERDHFMRVLLGLRLAVTGTGMSLVAVVAIALGYDGQMVAGAALMGAGVLLVVLQTTLAIPLAAQIRMGVVTGLDVGRQIATTALYVTLVLAGAGIVPFLAVTIPVNVVLLLATIAFVRGGGVSLRPSFDTAEWGGLIRSTVTFALATAVGTLYVYAALVLTELVASGEQTGDFAAAFRVFVIVAAVPGILATTAFPLLSRAARDDQVRLAYATQRLFEAMAILGGAAAIACVAGAPTIIDVVAGPKFAGAVDVLRIQGVALLMTFVIATWGFTLLALHRHREMVIVNAAALTVSAVTVLLLASAHGASGAAFGTLLGETTLATGYVIAVSRVTPALRPRLGLILRALPAFAIGLAVGLVPGVPNAVAVVLGIAAYVIALFALRAIPDEIVEHLPAPLRRFTPGA